MNWIAGINTLVFLSLAALHSYWAVGGQAGLNAALPTTPNGNSPLRPSAGMVWAVAFGLLVLSGLSATHLLFGPEQAPAWLQAADGGIAGLLLLRAIGDFRYVGLSKRIHTTTFARLDTRYYTPLCLLLAAICAWLAVAAGPFLGLGPSA
jgi:hypothetical protein